MDKKTKKSTSKKPSKSSKSSKPSIDDTALDRTVDGLVDSVMENLEEGYDNPLVPFETYVQKTKLEVKDDVKRFRMRLRKGYIGILREIMASKNIKREDKIEIMRHLASKHINSIEGDFRIYP